MKKKDGSGQPYDVGYGKPPVAHRFQAGQSGNPNGRRKRPAEGRAEVETLWKIMNEKVTIREGSKTLTVTKLEAAIRNTIVRAMKADPKALAIVLKAAKEHGLLLPVARTLTVEFVKSDGDGGLRKWSPKAASKENPPASKT